MASLNTAEVFGKYDFGLSQEEEERAARIHEESIIIDMLFQGPCGDRHGLADADAEIHSEGDYGQSGGRMVQGGAACETGSES